MKKLFLFAGMLLIALPVFCQSTRGQRTGSDGMYVEPGNNIIPPLTLFDRQEPFLSQLVKVQININDPTYVKFKDIYGEQIWNKSSIISPVENNEFSKAALNAKNAAFIYLVGIDDDGNNIKCGTSTCPTHNAFKENALFMLMSCNIEMKNPVLNADAYWQWGGKNLMLYLEAYDLLLTASFYGSSQGYFFSSDEIDYLETIRYRLQEFARNYFRKTNGILKGPMTKVKFNNHTLIAASSLGMAAVVLHSCKHKKKRKNWHPARWAEAAHNRINKTLWTAGSGTRMSDRGDQLAGYAEGPHYFTYAFESCLPFFRAFANFVNNPDWTGEYKFHMSNQTIPKHYYWDEDYWRLYEWFNDLITPTGYIPPYDDSYVGNRYPYLTPLQEDMTGSGRSLNIREAVGGLQTDPAADYLAIGSKPIKQTAIEEAYVNRKSGDIIMRSSARTPDSISHYIRISGETSTALNGGGHEHPDATSFYITAGDDILALDPGYIHWDDRFLTNGHAHHNLILVDNVGPGKKTVTDAETNFGTGKYGGKTVVIRTNYENTDFIRKIEKNNIGGHTFYVVYDQVDRKGTGTTRNFAWLLNGNGCEGDSPPTFSHDDVTKISRWTHNCSTSRPQPWALQALVGVAGGGGDYFNVDAWNGNNGHLIVGDTQRTSNNNRAGKHTRLTLDKEANKASFLAVLWPYRCWETPPTMTLIEDPAEQTVGIRIDDLIFNPNTPEADTQDVVFGIDNLEPLKIYTDPFDQGFGKNVEFRGENYTMSRSNSGIYRFGSCSSFTYFRKISLDSGDLFKYADTTYIESTNDVDASYEIISIYRYKGRVKVYPGQGNTNVTFFLPDYISGIDAVAFKGDSKNQLPHTYDTLTKKITITFSEGITNFTIFINDPCDLSCYFPSTLETIDTLFEFDLGRAEYLGHELSIEQPDGHLKITDASKMVICTDYTLKNKDSLTLVSLYEPDQSGGIVLGDTGTGSGSDTICISVDRPFDRTDLLSSGRSAIIIEDRAALVLETGSFTQVGANSTIHVKKGGNLIIMNGATLEIGNEDYPGYGEIIADSGSYVCIEMGAVIKFYDNDDDDTVDRHVFFVSKYGAGAIAGKNSGPPAITLPPYDVISCTPLCSLKNYDIVDNAQYGWSNVNDPFAHFIVRDTFCYGEVVSINGRKSLNETRFRFEICEWDTLMDTCALPSFWTPWDTGSVVECNFNDYFNFIADKNYKIRLEVENDCGVSDDTMRIIYVKSIPNAYFTAPDTVCPGYGTITVNGTSSTTGNWHSWSIESIDDTQDVPEDFENEDISFDTAYTYTGAVSSSFSFPGFYVKGGRAYVVTLSVYNYCGLVTYSDTVYVPLQATIDNERPIIISGGTSVTLYGVTTGGNAFEWKYSTTGPTGTYTYINNVNDTTTVSPSVSTWYVLSAGKNCQHEVNFFEPDPIEGLSQVLNLCDCIERDTIFIQVNQYALAGKDTTICKGDSAIIGVSGGSLPGGYTSVWRPGYNIEDSTDLQTKVAPDSTVTYTLYVYNSSVLEETDEVTVYVDTIPSVDFVGTWDDYYKVCFDNQSSYNPGTTYLWTFGDGDSSTEANPCHLYEYADTSLLVCLTVYNVCGDSTLCDTLYLPADSSSFEKKGLESGLNFENTYTKNVFSILNIVPNPSKGLINVIYQIPRKDHNSNLVITGMDGKTLGQYRLSSDRGKVELNLSNLASGVYLAHIQSNDGRSRVVRFIISK